MDSLALTMNRDSASNKWKRTKKGPGTRTGLLKPRTVEPSQSRGKGNDYEVSEGHEVPLF